MGILEFFLNILPTNIILIAFIGSMIGGEQIILFLFSMVGAGILPLWKVFIFSYLGTLTSDIIWFYFGRLKFVNNLLETRHLSKVYEQLKRVVTKRIMKNYIIGGIILKFAYGIRISTIVSLGKEKMSAGKFIISNSIGTLILHFVLFIVGWFAGKGSDKYLSAFESVSGIIKVILIIIILSYVLHLIIRCAFRKWVLKS